MGKLVQDSLDLICESKIPNNDRTAFTEEEAGEGEIDAYNWMLAA